MPMLTSVNDLVAANERFLEALKFQKRPTQPLSQTIWKIKDLYLRSRYQECIAKATRELRFADENTHPLHRAALSFYAGLSSDSWSRNMPTRSPKLFPMLKQATEHYQEAIDALSPQPLWKQGRTYNQPNELSQSPSAVKPRTPCRSSFRQSGLPVLSPTKSMFSTAYSPSKQAQPSSPDDPFSEDPFELENLDIMSPLPNITAYSPLRSPTNVRHQVQSSPSKTPRRSYHEEIKTPAASSIYSTPAVDRPVTMPPPLTTPIFQPTPRRNSLPGVLLADRQLRLQDIRLEREMEDFRVMIERHMVSVRRYHERICGQTQSALFAKSKTEERGRSRGPRQRVSNGMGRRTMCNSTPKASDTKSTKETFAPGGAVWI